MYHHLRQFSPEYHQYIFIRFCVEKRSRYIAAQIYRPHVKMDQKGTPILYVKLKKAMYGLLRSSLLFYRKLRGELEAYGFKINRYDPFLFQIVLPFLSITDTTVSVITILLATHGS